jgi:KamA family protein
MEYYKGWDEPWVEFGATEKQWTNWKWQLNNVIQDPELLLNHIDLTDGQFHMIKKTVDDYKLMRITPYYLSLMDRNPTGVAPDGLSFRDYVDPIFIQSVPSPMHYIFKGGLDDPMAEGSRMTGTFYQRYPDRGANMSSSPNNCHMFCTHCQRERKKEIKVKTEDIDLGMAYMDENGNIYEVLETGGDGLSRSRRRIDKELDYTANIDHMESVREATRLILTNPFAVTDEKLDIIEKYSKHTNGDYSLPNIYFVTHFNSVQELTMDAQKAVTRIKKRGFDIGNQTVLLKGINDDFATMSKLSRDLHHMGVKPYYIFQCHKLTGLSAEIVPINIGQYIVSHMRGQEGYSIPTYAVNMIGGGGKVVLTPQGDKGEPDFGYRLSRDMWTHDQKIVGYEELLRVRESDYEKGMKAMSEFYGDESIMDYTKTKVDKYSGFKGFLRKLVFSNNLQVRETASKKFRPSIIVVDDKRPEKALYVTNVKAPDIMIYDQKCEQWGLLPNGPELGFPDQKYVRNPSGFKPKAYR